MATPFIEKRKENRLPYNEKIIFTDGQRSTTAYAANISRGGVFVMSLEPFPIETHGNIAFFLPSQTTSLCVKAKVAHIVFDRQRCEVECGMGYQFLELEEKHKSILNLHILNEQAIFMELKKHLASVKPDQAEIARCLKKMPSLARLDLLALRYKVNRICTIFEAAGSIPGKEDEAMSA